jgi:hypothetical protein
VKRGSWVGLHYFIKSLSWTHTADHPHPRHTRNICPWDGRIGVVPTWAYCSVISVASGGTVPTELCHLFVSKDFYTVFRKE